LSTALGDKLAEIRKQKAALEAEREKLANEQVPWETPEGESLPKELVQRLDSERLDKLSAVDEKLAKARSDEEATLLNFILDRAAETNAILGQVRDATERLNASSREQTAATHNLEASSRRLNIVTDALLLLTSVLAVTAVGSYALADAEENGLKGGAATSLAFYITMVALFLIFLCLVWIAKRRRAPLAAAPPPAPAPAAQPLLQNPPGADDRRTKTLEFVGTLGGLLGIVVSLLLETVPTPVRVTYVTIVILFIMFAFLSYVSVSIGWDRQRTRVFLHGLSATFSGLIAMSFAVAFTLALIDVSSDVFKTLGIAGTFVAYTVGVGAVSIAIYFGFANAMVFAFDQMTPAEGAQAAPAAGRPPQQG